MPNYDFICLNEECGLQYEEVAPYDPEDQYPTVKCPRCECGLKEKLATCCGNFAFAQPEGTSRWLSDSTGHDYRFKHNLPNVIKQRRDAEIASKMGASPYRKIDDITNGKHFGEVK